MYYSLDSFISTNLQNQHLVLEETSAYSYWDTFAVFQETSVFEQTTHVTLSFVLVSQLSLEEVLNNKAFLRFVSCEFRKSTTETRASIHFYFFPLKI